MNPGCKYARTCKGYLALVEGDRPEAQRIFDEILREDDVCEYGYAALGKGMVEFLRVERNEVQLPKWEDNEADRLFSVAELNANMREKVEIYFAQETLFLHLNYKMEALRVFGRRRQVQEEQQKQQTKQIHIEIAQATPERVAPRAQQGVAQVASIQAPVRRSEGVSSDILEDGFVGVDKPTDAQPEGLPPSYSLMAGLSSLWSGGATLFSQSVPIKSYLPHDGAAASATHKHR